jgi:hypothetical protein
MHVELKRSSKSNKKAARIFTAHVASQETQTYTTYKIASQETQTYTTYKIKTIFIYYINKSQETQTYHVRDQNCLYLLYKYTQADHTR